MGVLLQGFFFGPGRISGVPSPLDGQEAIPFWWDHLASQANALGKAGFSAIWLPPPQKGASGSFSSGYDVFDDYDLGNKNQKGTVPTRYGSREKLQRCAAVMRANGIDVYVDLVENQRDGDDGHFNFRYLGASGHDLNGRFPKGPNYFHPHVPEDPGVFSDQFQFGRDLAPINGGHPKGECGTQLLKAADWCTRALDAQGFRLDNVKGVSTEFTVRLLRHGSLAGKFAVGEFADGNIGLLRSWADAVQHLSCSFDFPLRFMLQQMCNNPQSFDMGSLDHAGLAGVDPLGAVTFVENHDTDRGGIGGPIVRNKLLAYAYILTSEGYPCIFYRDYSDDANCFALKNSIDPLIWIHEHLADGPTVERWKDAGIFAFERTGGRRLLVGLNKDSTSARTIRVQTGFPPHTNLHDFSRNGANVSTDLHSRVNITIPANHDGRGYVCYSPPAEMRPFHIASRPTSQDYEGAADLDIGPALENERVRVCRVFVLQGTELQARLVFDAAHWTESTTIDLELEDINGVNIAKRTLDRGAQQDSVLSAQIKSTGFHTVVIRAANTPPDNKAPSYRVRVKYTAPQTI